MISICYILFCYLQFVQGERKSCGKTIEECSYELIENTLEIFGNGEMTNWNEIPLNSMQESIKEIIIHDGIQSIGKYAFSQLPNLQKISLPESITKIESNAFDNCNKLTTIIFRGEKEPYCEDVFNDFTSITVQVPKKYKKNLFCNLPVIKNEINERVLKRDGSPKEISSTGLAIAVVLVICIIGAIAGVFCCHK